MGVTKHRKCIVQPGTQPSADAKQEGMNNALSRANSMTSLPWPQQRGSKALGGVKAQRGKIELPGERLQPQRLPGKHAWAVLLECR